MNQNRRILTQRAVLQDDFVFLSKRGIFRVCPVFFFSILIQIIANTSHVNAQNRATKYGATTKPCQWPKSIKCRFIFIQIRQHHILWLNQAFMLRWSGSSRAADITIINYWFVNNHHEAQVWKAIFLHGKLSSVDYEQDISMVLVQFWKYHYICLRYQRTNS